MRKRIFKATISALSAAVLFVSCTDSLDNNGIEPVLEEQGVVLEASIASSEPETKTVRQSDGKVFWAPGDAISLFYGSGDNGGNKFTAICTEPAAVTNFTGTIGVITGGGEVSMDQTYFWGVYPYSETTSCNGSHIYTDLPDVQTSVAGSFSNGQFLTMGHSRGLSMAFYNICGGIRFTVVHNDIMSVTFKNVDGASIAGRLCMSLDDSGYPVVDGITDGTDTIIVTPAEGKTFVPGADYFVVMPPTVMSSGLEVTYKTLTTEAKKTFSSSINVKRSLFNKLLNKDDGLTFEPKNNNVEFSDANFKAYCVQNFDTDDDGEISISEAMNVTEMSFDTNGMKNLNGIECFQNLCDLTCQLHYSRTRIGTDGMVHKYDSNGIEVFGLEDIDIRDNTSLRTLDCSGNQLTALDVSKNTALTIINCFNNQLTSLNLRNNTALKHLHCGSNKLTALDVSCNTAMITLVCDNNRLKALDISNNQALTSMSSFDNLLTALDVSNNTALTSLSCEHNQITELDVSKNTALTHLYCGNNLLDAIIVSANTALIHLSCSGNQLTALDVSKNTALTILDCGFNQLNALDISKNIELTSLQCYYNQLSTLDVSNNSKLLALHCFNNLLTTLDISHNSALEYLNCSRMDTLVYLYIYDGQTIPNVTENRSTNYIPEETIIRVASEDEEPPLEDPEKGGNYDW